MARSQDWLALVVNLPVGAKQVTVSPDNVFCLGIPHDKLLVTVLADVEFVNVHRLTGATARLSECDFAQSPDFFHHVGSVVRGDDIDFIVAFVSHAELAIRCQLAFQQFSAYGWDDWLFHWLEFYGSRVFIFDGLFRGLVLDAVAAAGSRR